MNHNVLLLVSRSVLGLICFKMQKNFTLIFPAERRITLLTRIFSPAKVVVVVVLDGGIFDDYKWALIWRCNLKRKYSHREWCYEEWKEASEMPNISVTKFVTLVRKERRKKYISCFRCEEDGNGWNFLKAKPTLRFHLFVRSLPVNSANAL